MVAAADVRDRAERAEAVAALGDLHESGGALDGAEHRSGVEDGRRDGDAEDIRDDPDDAVLVVGLNKGRDLGQLLGEVVAVARGDAAAHDDGAGPDALRAALGELEGNLDGLLGRGGEDGAGVHDGRVGVIDAVGLRKAGGEQKRAHAVGVDLVLRAAEGDEEDLAEGRIHRHGVNPNDS